MLKSTHVLLLLLFYSFKMEKASCFLLFSSFLFVCLGNEAETEGELSVNFTHLFLLILLITCFLPPPPSLAAPGVAGRAKSPLTSSRRILFIHEGTLATVRRPPGVAPRRKYSTCATLSRILKTNLRAALRLGAMKRPRGRSRRRPASRNPLS